MQNIEILFALIATVLTAISASKWKKLPAFGKITLITVILCALIASINSFIKSEKDALVEKINSKYGEINTEGALESKMMIGSGENGVTLVGRNGLLIHDDYGAIIKVDIKDKKMLVNVVIRDLNSEVIAVIDDSEWTLYDEGFEYNDDDFSFEMVTKGDRKVFFQVFYKNGVIHLSGYFLTKNGDGLIMYNSPTHYSEMFIFHTGMPKTEVPTPEVPTPSEINIPRIFKYPRAKYYSEKL